MKFKVQSSKFENGRKKRVDLARALRTLNFDLRTSRQRRASVLVLVMTLLGILFVLGVAFLASMNFEADMIVSETLRDRAESRVTAVVDQLGSTLRDGLMSDARLPFGNPSAALSATAYAEMSGVQNSFSSVEPQWHPGPSPNPVWGDGDDLLVFSAYTDMVGLRQRPYAGLSHPQGFVIDTRLPNGGTAMMCLGGYDAGDPCVVGGPPGACPGGFCGPGPRVLDADGDGIVDSIMVDAKVLGFSDAQLSALSARLNPASMPTGNVYVGMRVLPHGGLVNLNASHPKLIENVLDVPDLRLPAGPAYGDFKHRPTLFQVSYSPLLEEPSLRRRGLLAPRSMPPSWLHGDPSLSPATYPSGRADMSWQLFAPKDAANGEYETVFDHRYFAYTPTELFPGPPNPPPLWAVRMEPFTADAADGTPDGFMPEYDRRHLVTTVSHDDLLARGGRVPNPAVPGGEEDILTKMTQANQTTSERPTPPALLPFEYAVYPETIPDTTEPNPLACVCNWANETCCRTNARKGRLQLSLPYLDDQIDAAHNLTGPMFMQCMAKPLRTPEGCVKEVLDRLVHLIHDAFFLLVRNAARVTTLEGTPCVKRCLAGTNQGKLCDSDAECPGSVCESVDCLYANGACGEGNRCTVAPTPPTAFNCASAADCSIPGSVCRADGVCTIQTPYWQDRPCTNAADCVGGVGGGEVCDQAIGLCVDAWTHQTHSQALISRTAAALTANLIDYADLECLGGPRDTEFCTVNADCPGGTCADRGIPTRVALRSLDFTPGMCIGGPNAGGACDMDLDCPGGLCSPPQSVCLTDKSRTPSDETQGITDMGFPIAPLIRCNTYADCSLGDYCAFGALQSAGREFHIRGNPGVAPDILQPTYVYGLERQPYITEVATLAIAPPPVILAARAFELFNPYDKEINVDGYSIVEIDETGAPKPAIDLSGTLPPDSFTVFASGDTPVYIQQLTQPTTAKPLPNALQFVNGWTIYLVRRVDYPGAPNTEIVVDQFHVTGDCLGVGAPAYNPAICNPPPQRHSAERVVSAEATKWTAPIALNPAVEQIGVVSLGTWNNAPNNTLHPVEVNFADLGSFSRPFNNPTNPTDPRNGSVSFPTTGSLLMLMRHANQSLVLRCDGGTNNDLECKSDLDCPGVGVCKLGPVKKFAFTTRLIGDTLIRDPVSGATLATIPAEQQIDNGRMPVFDEPFPGGTNWYSAHHLSASATQLGAPGNLEMLPWGQLVFDYFTALPLSNPGPYVDVEPGPAVVVALPDSLPRVDLDGLRVHGRININAAPWKVLAGLPFVPMQRIPIVFRDRIATLLGIAPTEYADAVPIGYELAHAMVAYRDLRPIGGTGDYATGIAADGVTPTPYARGWDSTAPTAPMARRGTGFMSVGELANVRHLGAASALYRIDSGMIDVNNNDNDTENFIDAVAGLVALGDWVTVRSQVFTVYGVLRGEEDLTIVDPDPIVQQKLQRQDADSRTMRFQETIDRLPTFLGQPVPLRIGGRTLTRYTDVRND